VLKACSEAKVGRVVVVSSVSAAMVNPNWSEGKAIDEDCWSDVDYCRATKVIPTKPTQGLLLMYYMQ
jgi:nucleoside-diphosphate-sugar epimerase